VYTSTPYMQNPYRDGNWHCKMADTDAVRPLSIWTCLMISRHSVALSDERSRVAPWRMASSLNGELSQLPT
jgi:hypothetical protein